MTEPRCFVAGDEDEGLRLDVVLARRLPDLSRSALAQWVKAGRVTVADAVSSKASRPIRAGESIAVDVPPLEPPRFAPEAIPLTVLFEDDDLIAIDKPAGLVVHPAAGHASGTLVNALLAHAAELAPADDPRKPGIVHRLDRDTSGVLVVAKTPAARAGLEAQFRDREVRKTYLAVVHGRTPRRGQIQGAIGRDPRDRKRMSVRAEGGKEALSRYRLVEGFPGASLLEVEIATGRTHQIRVHLQSIGHPVVGDAVYRRGRGRSSPLLDRFPRQALHAAALALRHPRSGADLLFQAPLPIDMEGLLAELRRHARQEAEGGGRGSMTGEGDS